MADATTVEITIDSQISEVEIGQLHASGVTGAGSGTVTSVALSTSVSGISVTGSPITSSGTLALAGTVSAVTEGAVTAHQAALSITESQISDLGTYLTSVAAADITDATADGIALITSLDANPFTDADESKLDGIEAGADVTDSTNVTAAGALMDSEVTNLAAVKAFDPADYDAAGTASGAVSTHAAVTSGVHGISAFGATLVDDADAATARATLGVDAAGTDNSTDVTLAGTLDYLTLAGQQITLGAIALTTDVSGILPIANGGTGASTAAGARTALDVDQAGTDNSTPVTIAAGRDYVTISGQELTLGAVDLAADVTGDLPLANLAQASGASVLLGRGSASGAGDFQEITLGTGLSMSGTVLSASASAPAMADITDYTETSVTNGEIIAYTGAGYENQTLAEAGIQGTITFGTGVETALGVNIGSAGAPVLLNGAGGTPSALTLTNATGLPLTTGVTGTLPVANGGTGATSLPSPSNYTPGAATVPGHLSGIDTALAGKASATTPYYVQAALTVNGEAIATGTNVAFVRVPVTGSITGMVADCDPNNEPSAAAVQVDGNVVNRTTGASTSFLTAVASISTSANTGTATIKSDGTEDVTAGDLLSFDIDQGSDGKDLIVTVEITPS